MDIGAWRNGRGPASGSNRVKRGGNWNNNANNCRVANRNNNSPGNENNNLGFRLVSTTHGKDPPSLRYGVAWPALSHPRPPAPRERGDEQGRNGGASTRWRKPTGNVPPNPIQEEKEIANQQVDTYRRQPRRCALRLPSSGHLRRSPREREIDRASMKG